MAVRLAEVVEPLGDLAVLTPEPLSALADKIRGGRRTQVEQTSRTLNSIPALHEDEEPDGPAFFALGVGAGQGPGVARLLTVHSASAMLVVRLHRRMESIQLGS